jgi:hypothetical protein
MPPSKSLTILFWNVGGAINPQLVANLAAERQCDIVALAELDTDRSAVTQALQATADRSFEANTLAELRLQIWTRGADLQHRVVVTNAVERVVLTRLHFGGEEYLLGVLHCVSKVNHRDQSQALEAAAINDEIRELEAERGHQRTILIGDFNMNPFEEGMVGAKAFHAVMSRNEVLSGSRQVQGREYPFFYNPMWGHFGDRTPGAPGSHFYQHAEQVCYFWNMFDQCLMRPEVCQKVHEQIDLVDRIGDVSLLDRMGRPSRAIASDHLPLCIRLVRNAEKP